MPILTRLHLIAALAAASALLAGCGVGAGEAVPGVTLRITEGHGARTLLETSAPKRGGEETVLQLLQRNADVATRYGGTYVDGIDGLRAETSDGGSLDWIFYVDGVVANRGASGWTLRSGDRVWWDRHDTGRTPSGTPAVVGSYPAPLAGGFDGRSKTVLVDCVAPARAACRTTRERLGQAGAQFATPEQAAIGRGDARSPVRVHVGTLAQLAGAAGPEAKAIVEGPRAGGIFVRARGELSPGEVRPDTPFEALDEAGRPSGQLTPGTGLVAAVRLGERAPVWFVTGIDERGVRRAAKALDEPTLRGKPAVLVDGDGARAVPEVVAR